MRKLVESWVAAELSYGNTPATALRQLNESLDGTKYTHSRLSQWRRSIYTPTPGALSYMLMRVLPWALREAGIDASKAQVNALERQIWVVVGEEDGENVLELL